MYSLRNSGNFGFYFQTDMYYLCAFMVGLVSHHQSNISDWAIDLHVDFVIG